MDNLTMSDTEFFDFFFGGVSTKNTNNNNTSNDITNETNNELVQPSHGHCASPIYSSTVSEPGYGFVEPGEIIDQDFEMISSSSTSSLTNSPIRAFHQQNKNKPQRITDVFGDIRRATGGKKRGPRPKILTREEKYQKRLDANDRERQRMGQLNVAFNHLRNVLPKHGNDRELSKFETIHLAKNYIRALNEMLSQAEQQQQHQSNSVMNPASV